MKKVKSKIKLRREYLTKEIYRVFNEHNQNYDSPRIALQLYSEGIATNKRVVATIMRKEGLLA
ncbi:MAG: IS3 family transposase [Fusobacteriaceae bacterium]